MPSESNIHVHTVTRSVVSLPRGLGSWTAMPPSMFSPCPRRHVHVPSWPSTTAPVHGEPRTHARTVARIAPSFTEISAKTMCLNPDGRGRERSVSGQDRIGRVGGITPGQRHPLHQPSNGQPSPSLPRCSTRGVLLCVSRAENDGICLLISHPGATDRVCVCVCVCGSWSVTVPWSIDHPCINAMACGFKFVEPRSVRHGVCFVVVE